MPMPVSFHEPLSELQQRAEDLEYSELLDEVSAALLLLPEIVKLCYSALNGSISLI